MTITRVTANDYGMQREVVADITFDSSYASGGEAITGAMLGMRVGQLDTIIAEPKNGITVRYVPSTRTSGVLKAMRSALAFAALSSPGLQIGTTSNKEVRINATTVYTLDGEFKSRTAAEVAFTATTHDIAPHASLVREAVYLVSLNSSNAGVITKGTESSGAGTAQVPDTPNGQTAIGTVRIAVAAGATPFDATTDALNAGHLTVTYKSFALPPSGQAGAEAEVPSTTDLSGTTIRVTARGR